MMYVSDSVLLNRLATAPPFVTWACVVLGDVWVGGSMANEHCENPEDWDLVVPFSAWSIVAARIPQNAIKTRFGGWRFNEDGAKIDVFPSDFSTLMQFPFVTVLWHPKSNTIWRKTEMKGLSS